MKILLVPPNDWLCHPLSSRLHFIFERIARHHQVHVINFKIGGFGKRQRATDAHLHNATLIPVSDLSAFFVLNAPYHYETIRKVISDNKIEVVVTSNILASSSACMVSRQANIPLVYDYLDHFPDSASLYYRNMGIKTLVRNAVEFLVKTNLGYADKIVVPSKSLERMMLTKYNINQSRLSLIPNGVDFEIFKARDRIEALKRIQRSDLKDYLLLIFLGSIESRFDLETPILAVNRLAIEGMKIRLLIVGPELSKYHFYLKNKYSEFLGIEFVGYVDSKLVPFYIGAADICLAPYKIMQTNFGLTLKLLEYLASEKVVLITDIPDVRANLDKNVVIYHNYNDLMEKILEIQKSKNDYSLKVKECYEFISHYSWDTIANSYEKLLENLIGSYT